MTPLTVFRIPYYSWIAVITLVALVYFLFKKPTRADGTEYFNGANLAVIIFAGSFVVVYALADEGYLSIDLRYILILPAILLLIGTWVTSRTEILVIFDSHRSPYEIVHPLATVGRILTAALIIVTLTDIVAMVGKAYIWT